LTNNYINDMNCVLKATEEMTDTNCGYELCIDKQLDK